MKRMATTDTLHAQPAPSEGAVGLNGLCGILGARGGEPAGRRSVARNTLVATNQPQKEDLRPLGEERRNFLELGSCFLPAPCFHRSSCPSCESLSLKTPACWKSCTAATWSSVNASASAGVRTTSIRSQLPNRGKRGKQIARRRRLTRFRSCALPATFFDTTKPSRGVPSCRRPT
jgi:hypothetical protein